MTRLRHLQRKKSRKASNQSARITLAVLATWTCLLTAWNWQLSFDMTASTPSLYFFNFTMPALLSTDQSSWPQQQQRQLQVQASSSSVGTTSYTSETISWPKLSSDWQKFVENRTIAFVHVGKAGGITIRGSTSLACSAGDKEECVNSRYGPDSVLSRQVKHWFHKHQMPAKELQESTSLLFNLRNPIDRLISIYRYSHPGNCNEQVKNSKLASYGCELKQYTEDPTYMPHHKVYPVFNTCFPDPAMEQFAQHLMTPYPDFTHAVLTPYQIWKCRKMAFNLVRGVGEKKPFPHMQHNYADYYHRTIQLHPDKEVFAVRTENEWDDLKALDVAIGGSGKFAKEGDAETHGSQHYLPSPLTQEAIGKICCLLEEDISYYQAILSRALNLDDNDKQQCMDNIRKKCVISTSWDEWRRQCQQHIKKDGEIRDRQKAKLLESGIEVTSTNRALPGGSKKMVQSHGKDPDMTKFKNRTIAFVHVGKAGGMTIEAATSLSCPRNDKENCMNERFPKDAVLARQVQFWFHKHRMPTDELENATSFLFSLRSPVERIVSTYRYSHPGNCNEKVQQSRKYNVGCELIIYQQDPTYLPHHHVYPVFNTCFPFPAMEQFAQSVLTPYTPFSHTTINGPLSAFQEWECRKIAYSSVRGFGEKKPFPHMWHNYNDYLQRTIKMYPDKEVFAFRTEKEWEDLKDLDLFLGGAGTFHKEGKAETHGSQHYLPSPLSKEAYEKLCCVLELDMTNYIEILTRAVNLDETIKKQSIENMKNKCGIKTSWAVWRQDCQARLKKDAKFREQERQKWLGQGKESYLMLEEPRALSGI